MGFTYKNVINRSCLANYMDFYLLNLGGKSSPAGLEFFSELLLAFTPLPF